MAPKKGGKKGGKVGQKWTLTTPLDLDQIDNQESCCTRCLNNDEPKKMVNNIYCPLGWRPYMIICSCGALLIGHLKWNTHFSNCKRASDFENNETSSIDDIVTVKNTEYIEPIDLATYQNLADVPEFGKYKMYLTVRFHHLDQWVCHCGTRSKSYYRLSEIHQKNSPQECTDLLAKWDDTYTTIEHIPITDVGTVDRKKKQI